MSTDLTELLAEHRPTLWRSFSNDNTILRCSTCKQDFGNATRKAKRDDTELAWAGWEAHLAAVIEAAVRDEAIDAAWTGFGDGIDWARETLAEEDRVAGGIAETCERKAAELNRRGMSDPHAQWIYNAYVDAAAIARSAAEGA